ncbi:MAG: hypothetical protein COW54_00635 [Rhodobacteraceae bacterium CG17_big_fil_post_rev_8_21_14_2_50_63_15]|nr:MAG: hypothetical protein COW54_00635 [Rhodobacteraceae bacterium CG17_big_fil_post_rev_8_21_14_2_50_63_15]
MTKTAKILRIEPDGPADCGLQEWERMNPEDLVAGHPVQRGHVYHERPQDGYLAGVWDCTAFTGQMEAYSVDEFMLLLEGALEMVLPDGKIVEIRAGDAFVIPKGFMCQWRQPGFVHKIFMILDGPVPATAANPSLTRITIPDLCAVRGGNAVMATRLDFLNAAGTMRVAVQDCAAINIPSLSIPENQLIHVLSGTLSLSEGNALHSFAQGETAYIHQDNTVGWKTSADTRLLIASCGTPG